MKKKIGNGAYRTVFEMSHNCVGKESKRKIKTYWGFTVRWPAGLYSLLKFGRRDMNRRDFANYQKLMKRIPSSLRQNFGKIRGLEKHGSKSVLVMQKVNDFGGFISKNLSKTGHVKSKMFWEKMAEIEKFLLEQRIPFFGITARNTVVKWVNQREAIPVIVDFKLLGARTYPFQLHLYLKSQAQKKIKTSFAKLREKYKTE